MDDIFQQWLNFLRSNGIAAAALLCPPASGEAIRAAEEEMGSSFPEALTALYRIGNGQIDPFKAGPPPPDYRFAPLFGSYDFNPIERMVGEWRTWQQVRADFDDKGWAGMHRFVTLRPGDPPVHREYWRPGWLPFATDGGGNSYALDMDPPVGGRVGQVIVIGSDEDERRVLAPDLPELLRKTMASPALSLSDGDDQVVFFSMAGDRG